MKKILLIQPTIYDDNNNLIKKRKLYFIGLTMPLLAALTKSDWEVEVCIETIEEIPFDTDAMLIGIGSMGHSLRRAFEIAEEFRKKGKLVIIGGMMASLIPEKTKTYCDSVVIGDVEDVWNEILLDVEKGELKEFYKRPITKLKYPLPKYEMLAKKKIGDFLPVQAGRGCPNVCEFCSIYCVYQQKYFKREIEDVLRDIRYIKKLGFKKFLLIDDNIIADREYMKRLCLEIKIEKMEWMSQCSIDIARDKELLAIIAESGCTALSFGLESINGENLKSINKSWCNPLEYDILIKTIHDAGIDVASEMMIGFENDTRESLFKTVDFIVNNKIEVPKFYIITPIPGTKFYEQALREKMITDHNIERYSPSKAVIKTNNFSSADLTLVYWEMYRQVYNLPNILRRTIFHKRFFDHPLRCFFNLAVNLAYRSEIRKGIAPIII
jgi:radical SAM superfamily enzyme YgiQ (UPF0313 family)